jgi:hypothetical protein
VPVFKVTPGLGSVNTVHLLGRYFNFQQEFITDRNCVQKTTPVHPKLYTQLQAYNWALNTKDPSFAAHHINMQM